jgi:hypothetical protein
MNPLEIKSHLIQIAINYRSFIYRQEVSELSYLIFFNIIFYNLHKVNIFYISFK